MNLQRAGASSSQSTACKASLEQTICSVSGMFTISDGSGNLHIWHTFLYKQKQWQQCGSSIKLEKKLSIQDPNDKASSKQKEVMVRYCLCLQERAILEYTTTGSGSGFLFLGDKTASFFSCPLFWVPHPSLFLQISSPPPPPPPTSFPLSLSVCLTLQICEAMHSE